MSWKRRIDLDPKIMVGKPVIKGTRIAVEFVVELLAEGWTHEQILKNYSQLADEDTPWHRVLRANGTPAPHLADEQIRRLRAEGVVAAGGKVDLRRYRWTDEPPDHRQATTRL